MDSSDTYLKFDENGICDYCNNFKISIEPQWKSDLSDHSRILKIRDEIISYGKGKKYDCIIGLSGGLDSSYTAYVAKEIMGLRPLLLHVDAGWNTEQAVHNIEKLVNGMNLELHTEVIDWSEMRDLQCAYLRSQVPDQDTPQDTAFFSALYKYARKNNIKYVLTGANYSTECCREPEQWGAYPGIDKLLINDIHRRNGGKKLLKFPIVDILIYKIYYQYFLGMKIIKPLNLIEYNKENAENLLFNRFGWKKFKHKHHESLFTRFYEDFWMPKKFGYEKRRAHFSSLIMTKQMSRDSALLRLKEPELSHEETKLQFDYVAKKLNFTSQELWQIFNGKNSDYRSYKNKHWIIKAGASILTFIGIEKRLFR
jgi:N-acetyl sugar amidotransferase